MGLGLKKPANEAGAAAPAILIGLFVAFGGILFGYDTGTISGILGMDYFVNLFATEGNIDDDGKPFITSTQSALIVSILSAGTFIGALLAAPVADTIGRRLGLIFSCVVFTVGVILQVVAEKIPMFVAGRFIAGLGVGLVSAIVPCYQSETAPKWIRGTIVGSYQFAITVGLLLAACANQGTHNQMNSGSYRIPLAIQFAWAIILSIGMFILPETPRFLIRKDKHDEALKSLSRLRKLDITHPALAAEITEIRQNHEYEMSLGKATYLDCFKGNQLPRIMTGCALQVLQQFTGINFIFYYGTTFFKSSGIRNPFIVGLICNLVNVFSTLPGLYMVEKLGRRKLLLLGSICMCFSEYIVAIVGVTTDSLPANKVLIAFVCTFIASFAASWGPVAWVVTGEIFPLKVRAKSLSLTTASNWLANFCIGYATPYLVDSGPGNANLGSKVFFIWGTCNLLSILFVYYFIYETKGLSLEEVDELYHGCRHAKDSPAAAQQIRQAAAAGDGRLHFSAKPNGEHVENADPEKGNVVNKTSSISS